MARDPDELELDAARAGDAHPDDTPDAARTRRLGETVRSLTDDDRHLDEPPPDLWDRIAARVQAEPGADEMGTDDRPRPDDGEPAPVTPLPDAPRHLGRRRRPTAWLVGAAAAALVVVAGIVAVMAGGDDGTTVARAELDPLPAAQPGTETASATVVERSGTNELDLPLEMPDVPGFYEVWLIDENVEGMVSLGPLRSDGRYEIPPGVDVGAFPVVDVSIEPVDGVPTHSGRSVLRGVLV